MVVASRSVAAHREAAAGSDERSIGPEGLEGWEGSRRCRLGMQSDWEGPLTSSQVMGGNRSLRSLRSLPRCFCSSPRVRARPSDPSDPLRSPPIPPGSPTLPSGDGGGLPLTAKAKALRLSTQPPVDAAVRPTACLECPRRGRTVIAVPAILYPRVRLAQFPGEPAPRVVVDSAASFDEARLHRLDDLGDGERFLPEPAPQVVQVLHPIAGLEVRLGAPHLGIGEEPGTSAVCRMPPMARLPRLEAAEAQRRMAGAAVPRRTRPDERQTPPGPVGPGGPGSTPAVRVPKRRDFAARGSDWWGATRSGTPGGPGRRESGPGFPGQPR